MPDLRRCRHVVEPLTGALCNRPAVVEEPEARCCEHATYTSAAEFERTGVKPAGALLGCDEHKEPGTFCVRCYEENVTTVSDVTRGDSTGQPTATEAVLGAASVTGSGTTFTATRPSPPFATPNKGYKSATEVMMEQDDADRIAAIKRRVALGCTHAPYGPCEECEWKATPIDGSDCTWAVVAVCLPCKHETVVGSRFSEKNAERLSNERKGKEKCACGREMMLLLRDGGGAFTAPEPAPTCACGDRTRPGTHTDKACEAPSEDMPGWIKRTPRSGESFDMPPREPCACGDRSRAGTHGEECCVGPKEPIAGMPGGYGHRLIKKTLPRDPVATIGDYVYGPPIWANGDHPVWSTSSGAFTIRGGDSNGTSLPRDPARLSDLERRVICPNGCRANTVWVGAEERCRKCLYIFATDRQVAVDHFCEEEGKRIDLDRRVSALEEGRDAHGETTWSEIASLRGRLAAVECGAVTLACVKSDQRSLWERLAVLEKREANMIDLATRAMNLAAESYFGTPEAALKLRKALGTDAQTRLLGQVVTVLDRDVKATGTDLTALAFRLQQATLTLDRLTRAVFPSTDVEGPDRCLRCGVRHADQTGKRRHMLTWRGRAGCWVRRKLRRKPLTDGREIVKAAEKVTGESGYEAKRIA